MKQLLLSDVVSSSSKNNMFLYNSLNRIEKTINSEFRLSVPLFITLGDSFQMVCSNFEQMKKVVTRIDELGLEDNIEFRFVSCFFSHKTSHINSVKKFNNFGKKEGGAFINPLICQEFLQANIMINQKINGLLIF